MSQRHYTHLTASISLRKAHMHPTQSLSSFPYTAFQTVGISVCLMMTLSCPFMQGCQSLPLSTPLSSRQSMWNVLCFVLAANVSSSSTLQIFWDINYLWWLLCPLVHSGGMVRKTDRSKQAWAQCSAYHERCHSPGKGGEGVEVGCLFQHCQLLATDLCHFVLKWWLPRIQLQNLCGNRKQQGFFF